jgi:hypothetical protein
VFADTWMASEANDDETVTMYGYGDASVDDTGRIGVSVVIYSPSMAQLAVQGGHSFDGFISATTSINFSAASEIGDYLVEAAGDYRFEHFDCGFTSIHLYGSFTARYFLSSVNGQWADYDRCTPGDCIRVSILRRHVQPPTGNFPQYADINVTTVAVPGGLRLCLATFGQMRLSC